MRKITCFCTSESGNCPDRPEWAVATKWDDVFLCERCYKNAKAGAYKDFEVLAAINIGEFVSAILRDDVADSLRESQEGETFDNAKDAMKYMKKAGL